jgi:predicted metalloprotease
VVEYNRKRRLDTSRIRDMRGGKAAIGGIGAIIVTVIALVAGVDPSALLDATNQAGGAAVDDNPSDGLNACDTGADIAAQRDCRFVAYENSIQSYWSDYFATAGEQYSPTTLTAFTGGVSTGCGQASSAVGPFYCPPDQGVYLDLGFFDVLEQQLGAEGGDFAEAYVIAHEVGHHVQNLTGQMERVQTREGADSDAVRLELQADCLAGMWAGHAAAADDADRIITQINDDDIARAIDAAETVGDDYIQSRTQGTVTPETWTHGSSEQRREWFRRGFDAQDLAACDTFAA